MDAFLKWHFLPEIKARGAGLYWITQCTSLKALFPTDTGVCAHCEICQRLIVWKSKISALCLCCYRTAWRREGSLWAVPVAHMDHMSLTSSSGVSFSFFLPSSCLHSWRSSNSATTSPQGYSSVVLTSLLVCAVYLAIVFTHIQSLIQKHGVVAPSGGQTQTFLCLKKRKSFFFFHFCLIPCQVRATISDFAVFFTIVTMVLVDYALGIPSPKLKVPSVFKVSKGPDQRW